MSRIIKFMNIFVPFLTIVLVPLIFPVYFALNLLSRIKKRLYSENVAGKVVLITGASSGIGEKLAYEYGKRGACLALVARSEDRIELEAVAEKVRTFGSPDLLVFGLDISNPQECSRLVDQTVLHFGRLDHLINNAGILRLSMFQDCTDVSNYAPIMDVNFWGSVHCTHSAIPHLRKTKGKIVVISSILSWVPQPKLSFYNASKAALTSFFETLRVEFGSDIGITIVTPGLIQSKISTDEFLEAIGLDRRVAESSEVCAKAILESACSGDRLKFLKLAVPKRHMMYLTLYVILKDLTPLVGKYLNPLAQ